jgi:hypothetical protein
LPNEPWLSKRETIQFNDKTRVSVVIAKQVIKGTFWIRIDEVIEPSNAIGDGVLKRGTGAPFEVEDIPT